MTKSRGVLIFGAVLAALSVLSASAALADILGKTAFALLVIGVAAIQVGWATYQQSLVIPQEDVAAYLSAAGTVVAGPAAGATNGTPVSVEPGTVVYGTLGEGEEQGPPGPLRPEEDPPW